MIHIVKREFMVAPRSTLIALLIARSCPSPANIQHADV
jgi:hypothetical protein